MIKYFVGLLLLGLSLFVLSKFMPEFRQKEISTVNELENEFKNNKISEIEYQQHYLELTTNKYKLYNLGIGFITISVLLIITCFIANIKSLKQLYKVQSINVKFLYFILTNASFILIILGIVISIMTEDTQYPIYDNSGIAISGLFSFFLLTMPTLNLILILFVIQKRIKTGIILYKFWIDKNKKREIFWLVLFIINFVSLVYSIYSGLILTIIGNYLAIYIILSFRAEFLSQIELEESCA